MLTRTNTNPRPRSVTAASKVQTARALWRLCAAIEHTCARLGVKATVADVLKAAGMSRRSFYQFFESLEHAIELMHNTQLRVIDLAQITDLPSGPGASWVLLSLNPSRDIGIEASHAFALARLAKESEVPRAVPNNDTLLAWAENFDKATAATR